MVYSEVVHVVGIHLDMQTLHYYSSLVIYGTEQEQSSEMYSQVLDQKLLNRLNLVLSEKLVTELLLVKEAFKSILKIIKTHFKISLKYKSLRLIKI